MKECADRKQVKTEIGREFPQQDSGPRIERVLGNALRWIFECDLVTFSLCETNCMKNNRCVSPLS